MKPSEGYILYSTGKEYQLLRDTIYRLIYIHPSEDIKLGPISLTTNGVLTIKKYYTWDGPSGPTKFLRQVLNGLFPIKRFMRGALAHDALYQLTRNNLLPASMRDLADRELINICEQDGMSAARRWWIYQGLKIGGASSVLPENKQREYRAPL